MDECTLTADCLLSHWNCVNTNLPKITLNISQECRLTQFDGMATGILDSNNAYINALFLLQAIWLYQIYRKIQQKV